MSKKYTLDNMLNEDLIYLIGINSSLDSYNLVFKLNKELNLNFVRSKKDIDLPKEKAYYNRFIAKNKSKEILYDFFQTNSKKLVLVIELVNLTYLTLHFQKKYFY